MEDIIEEDGVKFGGNEEWSEECREDIAKVGKYRKTVDVGLWRRRVNECAKLGIKVSS